MSKIELSSGMASGLPSRILRANTTGSSTDSGTYFTGLLQNGIEISNFPIAYISVMKGTMPTQAELAAFTSASRSTDILVTFSAVSGHFSPTVQSTNPATINSTYVNAIAAGTATWFWWRTCKTISTAITYAIAGTVGAINSGADLEMLSTTIAVGDQTRITNLRISFPTSWTY